MVLLPFWSRAKRLRQWLLGAKMEVIRREQQNGRRSTNSANNYKKVKKARDLSKFKCRNCHETGYYKRDYTKERAPQKTKTKGASMAFSVEDVTEDNKRGWIVDSGATSYMTGHLNNSISVHELMALRVLTVASGDNLVATAIGQAPVHRYGREVCVLQEVLFVKGLARNLVSVAAASRRGITVEYEGVGCTIRSSSGVTLKSSRKNRHMYVLEAVSKPTEQAALMTSKAPHVETCVIAVYDPSIRSVHNIC
ncbi:Integrase catalytic core protein [Phytophthora palmivora]|uniref:Integrase catalytic core protein n=1 Tax=Phytophthora palmivora TaxID=4796 RepID=A0A2P4YVQ8_9STRA|nr:Integrase catalytic core protein [Phytophthora palmivora]